MSVFYNLGVWVGRHLKRRLATKSVVSASDAVIVEDRPLSVDERLLLMWLIEHGTPEAREFVPQVDRARVVGRCRCGCPTIDFGIDGLRREQPGDHKYLQTLADGRLKAIQWALLSTPEKESSQN